ncbi:glycosyltransferase [Desulforegula conservatrix]|uniref:glycosyltransferase n=1 Tax=Desulforegula conservatrix TaxID=153026 RepID=UPI00040D3755|nr:glycosyltransferase [Desulforegula conservatrix]
MLFSEIIKKKQPGKPDKKNVLWWGRHDSGYSRNRMVWSLFESLGWTNYEFKPISSDFGYLESFLRNIPKPDLVWVANFRQRDVIHASMKARQWNVPLIFDPLISAYEKDVFEKKKWPEWHRKSLESRNKEKQLFSRANIVVGDTEAHADFFRQYLGVDPRKLKILYVGAEEAVFNPCLYGNDLCERPSFDAMEILFYGSFLELHGVDVIVEAAKMTSDLNIRWVLLGNGPCRDGLERTAANAPSVFFEKPVSYKDLPSRIARADILLGVFGGTKKSGMVIPNKFFQSMSMAKPIITQKAVSYPNGLLQSDVIGWVEPGSAASLAAKIREWMRAPSMLKERGRNTKSLYEIFFSRAILQKQLSDIVSSAILSKRKGF